MTLTELRSKNMSKTTSFGNFDRNFRIMQRFIIGFIAVVFVAILATWGFYGYVAYKAVSTVNSTENIPAALGKMVGEFEKARSEVK